jgi:hypothetical protein
MKELLPWGPVKAISESGAQLFTKSPLGENAAVLAESSGERPHRHAVVLASRRWRGGHDSARAETCRDNLNQALGLTSGIFGKSKEGALGASGSLKSSLGACEKINQ